MTKKSKSNYSKPAINEENSNADSNCVLDILKTSDDRTCRIVREAALAISDVRIDTDCSCYKPLEKFVKLFGLKMSI